MGKSLLEFLRAMLPWILFAVFDFLGARYNFPILREFTDLELINLLYVILLIGSFLAFHNMKKQKDELATKLDRRAEITSVLSNLSTLRTEGVVLRHEGARLADQQGIADWKTRVQQWRTNVLTELAKLSPTEVGLFDTLDQFLTPTFSEVLDPIVRHEMQMLFAETHRLESASLRWQGYAV